MPSEEICTHRIASLPLLLYQWGVWVIRTWIGSIFWKSCSSHFPGGLVLFFFFLSASLMQLRYSLIQNDKKENYWYYPDKLHLDAHILRYSKSYSWLQILSVFASGEFCVVTKCIDMQQDICYIFQDGLLTYRKKKDCVCHVWENYIFVLLTWLTLGNVSFLLCNFPILNSTFCCLCPGRAVLVLLTEQPWGESVRGWNPPVLCSSSSDCLPLSLEMGSVWMCHNKHLELRADKCPPLFVWQSLWVEVLLHRWALPSDQKLCFVGRIWKKLEMLIKGTGWWHWIVTSCNIGFVQMISSKHG